MTTSIVAFAQKRFYYGWLIVGVAFLAFTISQAYMGWIISVLLKPMSEEFGWSRATTVWPSTVGGLIAGMCFPFIGRILDHHGTKLVMLLCTIAVGGSLVGLSLITELWQFALLYGIGSAINIVGITNLTPSTAVANWFVRKRGRAMALATLGISFGGIILVPLAQYINSSSGWRATWLAMGIITWAVLLLPIALIIKRRPEDIGLKPDGDQDNPVKPSVAHPIAKGDKRPTRVEVNWDLRDAVRTRAFWLILVSTGVGFLPLMGVLVHLTAYLTDNGISAAAAASVVSLYAILGLFGKFFWGLMAERLPVRFCIMISVVLSATGIVILMFPPSLATAYLATAFYGTNAGAVLTLQSIIWPDYFGRFSAGAIRGLAQPVQMASTSLGTLLAAWLFDITGGYAIVFAIFAATMLIEAILIFFARPPKPLVRT